MLLNAALVDGPLGAFRLFSRRAHRIVDVVVIAGLALVAVLPFLDVDSATRVILGGAAAVLAVVWWNSAFENAPPARGRRGRRPPVGSTAKPADRSEAIGRGAGRLAGGIAKAVRDRTKSRADRPVPATLRTGRIGPCRTRGRPGRPPVASGPWRSTGRPPTSRS